MQVVVKPEHVVSFYTATCGINGPAALGSDEKDIILLVYVVIEAATGKVIGKKEILVRPTNYVNKDHTLTGSTEALTTVPAIAAVTPATAAAKTNAINSNKNQSFINYNNSNISTTTTTTTTNGIVGNNNNNNNNSGSHALLPIESAVAVAAAVANANNNGSSSSNEPQTLPIAEALASGKPLNEAIEEFDAYLRSLALQDADIALITYGQAPLRQCLHREACTKDIQLPAYYNRFCDLRKEFVNHRSGDLSRALVLAKDFSKVLRTPLLPLPLSIAEMAKELNVTCTADATAGGDYLIRESYEMVQVIRNLLLAGHQFIANEIVNIILEPGICSAHDEIDGLCIVRARGLPWQSSDQDIAKFFRGLNIAKGGVALCLSPMGRRNGEALVRFVSQEHRDMALKRHKHHIGPRYIEVYRATGEDFLSVAGGASNEAQAFLSKGAEVIIRMRGLPYDCTAKQVLDFFTTGEHPCQVHDGTDGVLFVKKPDGRATGDAFVLFEKESDAAPALGRHRESIGQRYIELFRSTAAEVQQVLNRSLDPKSFEQATGHAQQQQQQHHHQHQHQQQQQQQQPPLIAQLPTSAVQLPLLPQHLITSGTAKNCIRLRGLPYEANVEHILHFLEDFGKHISYQGVHMVINSQGQPSGEAFIQMTGEEPARLCAQHKHNQFMIFGKKYRYIEVFQCSGDDMNTVLNSGLQAPLPLPPTHATAAGVAKPPPLLSPGTPVLGASYAPFTHFGPPPTHLLATPPRTPHHAHAQHAGHAFYAHPLVYWPYPSPPVSPNAYFAQPTHSPAHVSGNHQAMYPIDFMPASPMSPPTIAIPHTTAGIILSPHKAPAAMTFVQPKQYTAMPGTPLTPTYHNATLLAASGKPQHLYFHQHATHSTPSPPIAAVVAPTLLPLAAAPAMLTNGTSRNESPELELEPDIAPEPEQSQSLLQVDGSVGNSSQSIATTNAGSPPAAAGNESSNLCLNLYIL